MTTDDLERLHPDWSFAFGVGDIAKVVSVDPPVAVSDIHMACFASRRIYGHTHILVVLDRDAHKMIRRAHNHLAGFCPPFQIVDEI